MQLEDTDLWRGVDRLIDRAPSLADLRSHGLQLLAGRSLRRRGIPLPEQLAQEEVIARRRELAASLVLARMRASYEGPMILMKGPEMAARYPTGCRPFGDLDVLAEDPEAAQRALIAAGFERVGFEDSYYDGLHHLGPLRLPEVPTPILEIHRRPNWVEWAGPPSNEELFATAVPSVCEVDGFLALSAPQQALALAAHSWIEMPLRRILDLIDITLVARSGGERREAGLVASRWGLERMWKTTLSAADSLLFAEPPPAALRIWARNLRQVRDRTVLENHVRRWLSGFAALPPASATRAGLVAVARDLRPAPTEPWTSKLRRTREAVRNPTRPAADHASRLGRDAKRARFRRVE